MQNNKTLEKREKQYSGRKSQPRKKQLREKKSSSVCYVLNLLLTRYKNGKLNYFANFQIKNTTL